MNLLSSNDFLRLKTGVLKVQKIVSRLHIFSAKQEAKNIHL